MSIQLRSCCTASCAVRPAPASNNPKWANISTSSKEKEHSTLLMLYCISCPVLHQLPHALCVQHLSATPLAWYKSNRCNRIKRAIVSHDDTVRRCLAPAPFGQVFQMITIVQLSSTALCKWKTEWSAMHDMWHAISLTWGGVLGWLGTLWLKHLTDRICEALPCICNTTKIELVSSSECAHACWLAILVQNASNRTLGSALSRVITLLSSVAHTFTCATKPLMSHNWLYTPDCTMLHK